MNTDIENRSIIETRKQKHLDICTDPKLYTVEGEGAGFHTVRLLHRPLPELNEEILDTTLLFLGERVKLPLFISCMTGGSEGGFEANKNLARAAQECGIAVGTGSIRVLFDHPELFDHFHLKSLAPDVPVMANLGAVQIRDREQPEIAELLKKLEVQALVVHMNPGQELFQPEGDRDFSGLKQALARFCEKSDIPVIVKETGFGIPLGTIRELLDIGVSYIDCAGAGGTNWVSVESYRLPEDQRESAEEFREWGIPTSLLMSRIASTRLRGSGKILASGGIRTGMDVLKSLVLGADMAGLALPLIRAEREKGTGGVIEYVEKIASVVRTGMVLTGSASVKQLHSVPYWFTADFSRTLESYTAADPEKADGEALR